MNKNNDFFSKIRLLLSETDQLKSYLPKINSAGYPFIALFFFVSLLLSLFSDLPTAMALLIVPSLVTNLWQAFAGGDLVRLLGRLWIFFLIAVIMVHVGAHFFSMVETTLLQRALGALLMLYALLGLIGKTLHLTKKQEIILSPICGAVNGLLTGLTGTIFVPGVMFLQAIGLSRNMLVQAMGILFASSTASLGLALHRHDLLPYSVGLLSTGAVVPALLGMWIGQKARHYMSKDAFLRVFLFALLGLGSYILIA